MHATNISTTPQTVAVQGVANVAKSKMVSPFSEIMNEIGQQSKASADNVATSNDKVTLSSAALATHQSTKVEYDPSVIFRNAQKGNGVVLFESVKPIESILPGNIELLDKLKAKTPNSMEEKFKIDGCINVLMAYGDRELYPDESAVARKLEAHFDAFNLYSQDISDNPEKYPHIQNLGHPDSPGYQSKIDRISSDLREKNSVENKPVQIEYDPAVIFQNAQKGNGVVLFEMVKPLESILPENRALLEQLKAKTPSSMEERFKIEESMNVLMQYGDKELYPDEAALFAKRDAHYDALFLYIQDIGNNPEKYPHMKGGGVEEYMASFVGSNQPSYGSVDATEERRR